MEDLSKFNNLLIRNGTYYFRVRVPQDLLASIGKKEIKVSLKTKDPREIKSKLALETIKVEASFKAARRALASPPEIPNPNQILAAVEKHQTIVVYTIICPKRTGYGVNSKGLLYKSMSYDSRTRYGVN